MLSRITRVCVFAALVTAGSGSQQSAPVELAPGALSAETRAALERTALGKSRAALDAAIRQLPLGESTLGEWIAASLPRERALRAWVRAQPAFGAPRVYSDATCDATTRATPEDLLALLQPLAEPDAAGAVSAATLAQAARGWRTVWADGQAARQDRAAARKPPGWEDIAPEGIQLAKLGAEADALEALLDEAGRLKVSASRRLDGLLRASSEFRAELREAIKAVATIRVEPGPDGLASAEAGIKLVDLIRLLSDARQAHPEIEGYPPSELRGLGLLTELEQIRATGYAGPPARYRLTPRFTRQELDAPSWVSQTLKAVGRTATSGGEASDADAAWLDGVDVLRRQVEELPVQSEIRVRDVLAHHPQLKPDVLLFLTAARPVGSLRAGGDGAAELPIELPLPRLWQILRRAARTIEIDAAPSSSSAPASAPAGGRG